MIKEVVQEKNRKLNYLLVDLAIFYSQRSEALSALRFLGKNLYRIDFNDGMLCSDMQTALSKSFKEMTDREKKTKYISLILFDHLKTDVSLYKRFERECVVEPYEFLLQERKHFPILSFLRGLSIKNLVLEGMELVFYLWYSIRFVRHIVKCFQKKKICLLKIKF